MRLKRWRGRFELSEALLLLLATRIWQALAGLIGLYLIAKYLSPEAQGFYYTFASLLALQSFIELGLYIVVINVASHQWAHLSLSEEGYIEGNPDALSRLISLGHLVFKWYLVAAALFVVLVGASGYLFFHLSSSVDIDWELPWLVTVLSAGISLWAMPFVSLLEGCNQMVAVQRFRLTQAVIANIAMCVSLMADFGLWSAAIFAFSNAVVLVVFLTVRSRRFFQPFYSRPFGPVLSWKVDIWPMQFPLAIQGAVNFFMYSLFNPVMFYFHGPVIAGQMGMTLQITRLLQTLAESWLQIRTPAFGIMVARKEFKALDSLWRKVTALSIGFLVISGFGLWLAVFFLVPKLGHQFADRILQPFPMALLILCVVLMHAIQCLANYWRAHRCEPMGLVRAVPGLIVGLLVWWWGKDYGPVGAAFGFITVVAFVSLPLAIWSWKLVRDKQGSI